MSNTLVVLHYTEGHHSMLPQSVSRMISMHMLLWALTYGDIYRHTKRGRRMKWQELAALDGSAGTVSGHKRGPHCPFHSITILLMR